jgi:signal transduction histidine kinase
VLRAVSSYTVRDMENSREPIEGLEKLLAERTEALRRANEQLQLEIEQNRAARLRIEEDQKRLRRLATELSLAEARERREIAVALHDHIIQEFAFVKLRIAQFRGDAVFYGFERNLEEILALLDRAIHQTRKLTFDLSPPVLYDLGLAAALEWLAERYLQRHQLRVELDLRLDRPERLPEALRITAYKCVQELLTNIVKYADVGMARLHARREGSTLIIEVVDEGKGFDPDRLTWSADDQHGFGLFSIRERLRSFGGEMTIASSPGAGTKVRLGFRAEG